MHFLLAFPRDKVLTFVVRFICLDNLNRNSFQRNRIEFCSTRNTAAYNGARLEMQSRTSLE